MPTQRIGVATRVSAATLLVALLAGCGKSAEPEAVPPPPPAAATPPPAPPTDAAPASSTAAPNTEAPGAPAQSAPAAPPPSAPSAAPAPAASNEPHLESMSAATASAKMTVPVDLRFQFDGSVLPGQPVTLHLAALPRVAGSHLTVSVKSADGVRVDAASMAVEKVNAAGVYRQQLSITTSAGAPAALRVLVTMDLAEGSGFGFFYVPLASGGTTAQKRESVKQR